MAVHPYAALRPEYEALVASMKVTRKAQVDNVARKLLQPKIFDQHLRLQEKTRVPAIFSATLFEREASNDFRLSFGQGDPWNQISTHVPKGHKFNSWIESAIFYTGTHGLNVFVAPLSMAYLCWKGEAWNGFGPRNHGRRTGYLWSGTNHYDPPTGKGGKYVADGQWSSVTVDKQLGIIPVMARMIELRPELDDGFDIQYIPGAVASPLVPTPVGVGEDFSTTAGLQAALNKVMHLDPPLDVDGNYGRLTRLAVRAFQKEHGLVQDGLAGPRTFEALEKAALALA